MDYARHYAALIERAKGRTLDGYAERHHIVPRCMGGSDDAENIAVLTPEEHYVAHQLLVKMNPGVAALVFAANAMIRGRPGNRRYGWLRRAFSQRIGEYWSGRQRKPFTEQHRQAIAAAQLGRKRGAHSEEHRRRLAEAHTGKTLTPEHREKLAAAKRGVKRGPYPQSDCPHCGKVGAIPTMKRWHFDSCKERTNAAHQ